ncbi:MAG: amino acid permease [Acidobacteria bacterium]|jgi:arginine:ornithine antiporter/lysine permease|nr:amino acid permease [Acidobacteriota bacterium]
MEKTNIKVLGFLPLLALVVGSIVGAGIFNSPADLGSKANPGWVIVAWLITAVGIFSLVKIFQYLSGKRPELEGGIYTYAHEVAGEFVGFNSAYGYWWSTLFTNLAYLFAIPKILSFYIPALASNKWLAFILASTLLWIYYFLILSGIKTAGIANTIITLLKLTPLIFVIGVTIFMFKPSLIGDPFAVTLGGTGEIAGFWQQINGSFGILVFAFLGIESAVVISSKARNPKDVGPVTLLGFIITLTIYVLVSTLTMGVAPAKEIVNASSPLGAVLGYAVGDFGRHLLNFGFLFSVMGALLSWLLLTAETPYIPAVKGRAFPKVFAKTNQKATPVFSLTITNIITQAILIILYIFSTTPDIGAQGNAPLLQNLYFAAINLSVICALVPYVMSSILGIVQARREKNIAPVIYAILSIAFFLWVFVAMAKYTAAAVIIYMTGLIFRFFVHRERSEKFPLTEVIFYVVLMLGSIIVAYFIGRGAIRF